MITSVEGYAVASVSDLTRVLRRFQPGDTVTVKVWRNGQEVELSVVLDERPAQVEPQETEPFTQTEPEYEEIPFQDFWDRFSDMFPFFGG